MQKNRLIIWGSLFITMIFLTGCWDRVEIEERGFVMGMGIDLADPEQKNSQLAVTYQIVIPAKMQTGGKEGGGGGGGGIAFTNITTVGDTLFETVRKAATRSSRRPYFEHNKLILIGEDLARSGKMARLIDFLLRDHEMRRQMKIIVVKGEARDAFKILSPQEKLTSNYLEYLSKNSKATARMPKELSIGDMSEKLIGNSSFITQRVIPDGKAGKMEGAAVFRAYSSKMVGWLDNQETQGVMWVTGEIKSEVTKSVLSSGEPVVFELRKTKTSIEPNVKNGTYQFNIQIETEGTLAESWANQNAIESDFIDQVEKSTEKKIKLQIKNAIQKLQKEYQTDALGLGDTLMRKQPRVWDQVKDNWDHGQNVFADAKINVDVHATIRSPGVITQAGKKH